MIRLNNFKVILPAALVILCMIILVSWGQKQAQPEFPGDLNSRLDTLPEKKKQDKKIRDLDDVLHELDQAELKLNAEKIQKEMEEALSKMDKDRLKLEMEKAKMDIDLEKLKKEVESSMAKIDWEKIKQELDKVRETEIPNMEAAIEKAKEEIKKVRPEIEKSLEKAKEQIEKVKMEMKEFKSLVDDLEKEGLLDKKQSYTIIHKNGELTVNDKPVPKVIYEKHKGFLDKQKDFTLEKSDEDFNIKKK